MARQSYFITGGAGFIGSHLTDLLLQSGHQVTALDDLSTGRRANLSSFLNHPNYRLVEGTVENETLVGELISNADAVFHLASAVGVQLIVDEPVRSIRTTIHGTEVVLEAARRSGSKPVLITSSSEVYGKGSRVPFSEEDDVVMGATRHSRWCYAYSKGVDEFLGFAYHKQYKLPVTMVRLFNTVGPRQVGMYGMVLPRFVEAALANRPIQVYGDGTQTRCFCHVSDVVKAIFKLTSTPSAAGDVYNLGSDQETSINALAERVIAVTGSSSTIEHIPYEVAYGQAFDDMPRRVPRLDKVRKAIGFAPTFDLDAIIRAVADYQREHVSGARSR